MSKIKYSLIFIIFIFSCDNNILNNVNKKQLDDSIQIRKQFDDSLNILKRNQKHDSIYNQYKKGVKVKNNFDFGYMKVKAISKLKFSNEVNYQLGEDGVYGYKTAQRNYVYANIKLYIYAKETPKEMGIKTDDYRKFYLPRLSLYEVVDRDSTKKIKWLYDLDNYNMVYRMPSHIGFLDYYFDYEENGELIFYNLLKKETQKKKLLLTIRSGESYRNDQSQLFIDLQNIIWKN